MVEHVRADARRRALVFAGNTGPIRGRHRPPSRVARPVDRAAPELLTPGTGLEWTPVVTGDGRDDRLPRRDRSSGRRCRRCVPVAGGAARMLGEDRLSGAVPGVAARHARSRHLPVAPTASTVHAQLFEPPGSGAAKHPAVVYVHGGPPRQMLLGWHYSDYYANDYALNQYLASRGFVVLSLNYRLGIGYGYASTSPRAAARRAHRSIRTCKAAAQWLRARREVDPARIGIWGGSYGGYLTALALAAIPTSSPRAWTSTAYTTYDRGSASAAFARARRQAVRRRPTGTRRPRCLAVIAGGGGDLALAGAADPRRRRSQRALQPDGGPGAAAGGQGVPFEEMVIPDDTHHWMRHANELRVYKAAAELFERKLAADEGRR